MDPYGRPTPYWVTPKLSPLYNPLTLNGNWLERQALAVDLAQHATELRAKRALDIDRRIWIYEESKKNFPETGPHEDGSLFYGETIHLSLFNGMVPPTGKSHKVERPALAIDLYPSSVEDSGCALAYATLDDAEPKGRSIFTIKSEDRIEYPARTKKVCYGDSILLVSGVDWQGMEWRLTSALEHLYDINLKHRKQTVWLHPIMTKKSLWTFLHVDQNLRPVMEGQPVDATQPILLRHVLTGRNLTVNFLKRFRTAYGVEYLMTCDMDLDIHRVEHENSIFRIRQISFPPWKLDVTQEKDFRSTIEKEIHDCKQEDLSKYAYFDTAQAPRFPHPSARFGRPEDADQPTLVPRIQHLR